MGTVCFASGGSKLYHDSKSVDISVGQTPIMANHPRDISKDLHYRIDIAGVEVTAYTRRLRSLSFGFVATCRGPGYNFMACGMFVVAAVIEPLALILASGVRATYICKSYCCDSLLRNSVERSLRCRP